MRNKAHVEIKRGRPVPIDSATAFYARYSDPAKKTSKNPTGRQIAPLGSNLDKAFAACLKIEIPDARAPSRTSRAGRSKRRRSGHKGGRGWGRGAIADAVAEFIALANIYLHYVLDEWFEQEVKPRLKGVAHEIRFADDAVLCFQYREDAEKVMEVLPKRFAKYGLTLHPEKTWLVDLGGTRRNMRSGRGRNQPRSTSSASRTSVHAAGEGNSQCTCGR